MFCACVQINAILLIISLGSLAKSQLGKTPADMTPVKSEKRKEYMEVGKYVPHQIACVDLICVVINNLYVQ